MEKSYNIANVDSMQQQLLSDAVFRLINVQ